MSEIKVNLYVTLPGSVMYSEQECSKNPKLTEPYTFKTQYWDKKDKALITNIHKTSLRKCIPAMQVVKISQDSYDYMVGENWPESSNRRDWRNLSKKKRLEYNLKETALALGGTGEFHYVVFGE